MRQARASQSGAVPPLSEDQVRQRALARDLEKFRKEIRDHPCNICFCCDRITYPRGGSSVDLSRAQTLLSRLYEVSTTCPLPPLSDVEGNNVWLCTRCMAYLNKGKIPPMSVVNNMRVDEIPPELARLSVMEQRLISRVQAFMKLIVLPLGQRALAGQTINFPVDVSEVCNALPRPVNSDGIVLVKPPDNRTALSVSASCNAPPTCTCYPVNRNHVMEALAWLKHHNPLYHDVVIDMTTLPEDTIPATNTSSHDMETGPPQLEGSVIRMDFTLPNVEATDVLNPGSHMGPMHTLSRVSGQPISLFDDNKAEEMAFPCLFPTGVNGFHTARDPTISILDYIQAHLLNADNRWASNIPYLLWSCNLLEQHKLRDSVSIAMRMRSSSGGRQQRQPLTAGELTSEDAAENPDIEENCYAFMRNIRGTAAYWQRAKLDLISMFRTLGPPAYFITLSADDMNWPDLMHVLAKRDGMNLTDEEVLQLPSSERRRLLCSYPVVVAQHFSHRFNSFVNHVMKGEGQPIGEVVDFFWRVEFQQRGSPHIHSLWWVKDAPNLDITEGKRQAPAFIDRFITCHVPQPGEDNELRSLVLRLQKHNHSATCRKDGRRRCRFDYPKKPCAATRLKRNADVGNKARFYLLKREEGEEFINPYNASLLRAWGANMDIQMVGSVYGAAQYVCSYMCKDEPQELKQLIAANLARLPENSTQRQRLLKIGNTLISHRVLSAQEAVYRTTGLHLRGSTRSSVFVNTARPEKHTKILRPTHQLRSMAGSDTNVFQAGLHERYATRPPGDPFDDMSLANFAVWYAVSRTPSTEASLATSSRAQPRYELQNGLGTIYLRRKQACLRVPTFSPESHGDDYYYHLLVLYLPWRDERRDLFAGHATAMKSFLANRDRLRYPNQDVNFAHFADEVQRAVQNIEALNEYGDAVYAPLAPGAAQAHLDINDEGTGMDPVYNQELYLDPSATAAANPGGEGVGDVVINPGDDRNNDFLTDLHDGATLNTMSRRRFTNDEFAEKVASLNESQRAAYRAVVEFTRLLHGYQMGTLDTLPRPLRLFITGGAGTGKSHVISVIREHLERTHLGAGSRCILMAPTGVAAFNIGGLTIHRALNLPVEHGRSTRYRKLSADKLDQLRRDWRNVDTVVIDEISMVSYQTLCFVHRRLTEIKGTDDVVTLFGGLNVIAVGDFFQLPPVRDKFVFEDGSGYIPSATHLWRDQFQLVELTTNMRQRGDAAYSQLLNRVRTGDFNREDLSVLRMWLTSGVSDPIRLDRAPFIDALRLLPLKEQVEEYNQSRLRELSQTSTVYKFEAEHAILESSRQAVGVVSHSAVSEALIPKDDRDCAGLPRTVSLAVGAQVMLRRNIVCEEGLVNGARGIVVGFTWPEGHEGPSEPGVLPNSVLVKFHDARVGRVSRVTVSDEDGLEVDAVPIEPISAKFYGRQGVTLQRTQLPLLPCWAATIHKVQGLSLDAAVIDLGPKVFEDGMAYVALSRVRTLEGVALLGLVGDKIRASTLAGQEMDRLRRARNEASGIREE